MTSIDSRRTLLTWSLAAAAIACAVPQAQAQADAAAAYPARPVRLILPSAAGGAIDIAARIAAEHLSARWKQQVLVENRPGGNGLIGQQAVATAAADGYTLFVTAGGRFTVDPVFDGKATELNARFKPLALLSDNPIAIIVNKDFPASNLRELIAQAKASPGKYPFGSPGTASLVHLAAEWVIADAGIQLRHIAYKGAAPAAVAAASGEVPVAVVPVLVALPHVKAGSVKAIAVASARRAEGAPDWPTVQESGLKDIDISVWSGVFARTDTPPAILAKIERDLKEVLDSPAYRNRIKDVGAEPGGLTGEALERHIARETSAVRAIVDKAGIKVAH